MSAQSDAIKLEMRLSAIEYLLCKLYVGIAIGTGTSAAEAQKQLDAFREGASGQLSPKLDPAMSDLASAEWAEAIDRLIAYQKAMLAQAMGQRQP